MSMTKKEKELLARVIAEWKKKYPKATLAKLKKKAYEEAMEACEVPEMMSDIFYEGLAAKGQHIARALFKGKISAKELDELEDTVWDTLMNENLADVQVILN